MTDPQPNETITALDDFIARARDVTRGLEDLLADLKHIVAEQEGRTE